MSVAVQQSFLMRESASEAGSAALEGVGSLLYAAHLASSWYPVSRSGRMRWVSHTDS